MRLVPTDVTRLQPGDQIYVLRTNTKRTVKTITPVPGKRAVKVVFASKDRATFDARTRVPVIG